MIWSVADSGMSIFELGITLSRVSLMYSLPTADHIRLLRGNAMYSSYHCGHDRLQMLLVDNHKVSEGDSPMKASRKTLVRIVTQQLDHYQSQHP